MNLLALEVEGIGTSHHAQDKTTFLVPTKTSQKLQVSHVTDNLLIIECP